MSSSGAQKTLSPRCFSFVPSSCHLKSGPPPVSDSAGSRCQCVPCRLCMCVHAAYSLGTISGLTRKAGVVFDPPARGVILVRLTSGLNSSRCFGQGPAWPTSKPHKCSLDSLPWTRRAFDCTHTAPRLQRACIGDDLDEPNRTRSTRKPIHAIDFHSSSYPTTLNHLAIV